MHGVATDRSITLAALIAMVLYTIRAQDAFNFRRERLFAVCHTLVPGCLVSHGRRGRPLRQRRPGIRGFQSHYVIRDWPVPDRILPVGDQDRDSLRDGPRRSRQLIDVLGTSRLWLITHWNPAGESFH